MNMIVGNPTQVMFRWLKTGLDLTERLRSFNEFCMHATRLSLSVFTKAIFKFAFYMPINVYALQLLLQPASFGFSRFVVRLLYIWQASAWWLSVHSAKKFDLEYATVVN